MQNNWKAFAITSVLTGTIMTMVLFWDALVLKPEMDLLYCLIKGTTILSMLSMGYVSFRKRKSLPIFEDLYCLIFYVYSFYGMACIDMTYVYSFLEAIFISALVIRQDTKHFLLTSIFGLALTVWGFVLTTEPVFVAAGQSYKPHAFTMAFLFFAIATTSHFVITRYQKKYLLLNEKFAMIGKQSSFLMHEIKNPLNRVIANAHNDLSSEIMEDIRKDSQKISGLVSGIEVLIHNPSQVVGTFSKFDFKEIQTMLVLDYGSYITSMNIKYDFDQLNGPFYGNKFLFFQVLKNIVLNAIEAIGYRKDVQSLIEIKVLRLQKQTAITISNTNSMINPRDLTFIFDPHFTTKKNNTNRGLGLSLCKSIVEAHAGNIVASSSNDLTKFEIALPDFSEASI